MKHLILKLAEKVLPQLLTLSIKLLEEALKVDLDGDKKIGR